MAQAQAFLPEETIHQMSAAVNAALFSPSTLLIGGAALLAAGYVAKKTGDHLATAKLQRLLDSYKKQDATSLNGILSLLNGIKNRELFK